MWQSPSDLESTVRGLVIFETETPIKNADYPACPGRFFASNEVKVMLSHLIMNYEIRTEVDGVRPANLYVGQQQLPHPTAKILFKKREN